MGDHRDYVALDWVKGEIGETLQQAQQALEAFVENPKDSTRLRFCLTYIHQVHGTLQMVEFYGAALLAEEMEKLARAMMEGKADSINDAQEVLMQSILQLPSYLENVKSGSQDIPVVLLPILNDLRTARGDKPLTETALFTPRLEKAYELSAQGDYSQDLDPNFDALTRKLRQMYQFALIGVIRQQDLEVNLGYLVKVMVRLERLCVDTPLGALWWVSTGFVEALSNKDIALGSTTKTLLRLIDKELKKLTAEGKTAVNNRAPEELLKNVLYYIAKCESDIARVSEIKQAYRLDTALPNEDELAEQRQKLLGPNKEAIGSVVSALIEEIAQLKERLNSIVTTGPKSNDSSGELEGLLPGMKQVADTMAVLGLGMPRRVVQNQIEVVGELVAGTAPVTNSTLMDVAGAFLYVEASLTGLVTKSDSELATDAEIAVHNQLSAAKGAVIREARQGMEKAKQAVVGFLASDWDQNEIRSVPELFASIRGGLLMVPMVRAANILQACHDYVSEELLSENAQPEHHSLELLAEVISGVEYYLDTAESGIESNDYALEMAEKSVLELGLTLDSALPADDTLPSLTTDPTQIPQDIASIEADLDTISLPDVPDDIPVSANEERVDSASIVEFPQRQDLSRDESLGSLTEPKDDSETSDLDKLFADEVSAESLFTSSNEANETAEASSTDDSSDKDWLRPSDNTENVMSVPDSGLELEDTPNLSDASIDQQAQPVGEEDEFSFDEETASIIAELDESLKRANEELETLKGNDSGLGEVELDTSSLEAENFGDAFSDISPEDVSLVDKPSTDESLSADDLSLLDSTTDPSLTVDEDSEAVRAEAIQETRDETLEQSAGAAGPEESIEFDEVPLPQDSSLDVSLASVDASEIEMPPLSADTDLPKADSESDSTPKDFHEFESFNLTDEEIGQHLGAENLSAEDLTTATEDLTAGLEETGEADSEESDTGTAFEPDETPLLTPSSIPVSPLSSQEIASIEMSQEMEEDDLIDEEIIEIFLEEADEVLEAINEEYPKYYEDTFDQEALVTVRRSFHTLKGSGRMVQALVIGELAWSIENMLNRILDMTIEPSPSVLEVVEQTRLLLPFFINDFRESNQRAHKGIAESIMATAHALSEGQEVSNIPTWYDDVTTAGGQGGETDNSASVEGDAGSDRSDQRISEEVSTDSVAATGDVDHGLIEVFRAEVDNHMGVIREYLRQTRLPNGLEFTDALQRALHTLKGSAIMAELDPIADIASPMERFVKDLRAYRVSPDQEAVSLIAEGLSLVEEGVEQLDNLPLNQIDGAMEYIARIETTGEEMVQAAIEKSDNDFDGRSDDAQLLSIFLSEGMDLLIDADSILSKWRLNPTLGDELNSLLDELRTLARGAQMADQTSIAQLSLSLEKAYSAVVNERIQANDIFFDTISRGHEVLINMMDQLAAGQTVPPAPELIESIELIATQSPALTQAVDSEENDEHDALHEYFSDMAVQDESQESTESLESESLQDQPLSEDVLPEDVSAESSLSASLDGSMQPEAASDGIINGPVPSYISVINVLVDTGRKLAKSWQQNPSDRSAIERLQSNARAIKVIADRESVPPLTHLAGEVEMLYAVISEQELIADDKLFALIDRGFDKVNDHIQRAQSHADIVYDDVLIQELQNWIDQSLDEELNAGSSNSPSTPYFPGESVTSSPSVEGSSVSSLAAVSGSSNSTSNSSTNTQLDVAASLPDYVSNPASSPEPSQPQLPEDEEDAELVAVFLEESREIMESISNKVDAWRQSPDNLLVVMELQRELHTLKGGARMAELDSIGTLCHELESIYAAVQEGKIGYREEYLDLLERSHDQLNVMLENVASGLKPGEANDMVQELHALLAKGPAPTIPLPGVTNDGESETSALSPEDEEIFDEYEAEILEIFIDEAQELIAALDQTIHDWEAEPEKLELSEELQRILHTLKGGARLSGHTEIGDLSHEFEAFLAQALSSNPELNNAFFQEIHRRYDMLAVRVEQIQQQLNRMMAGEGRLLDDMLVEAATPESSPENEESPLDLDMASESIDSENPVDDTFSSEETHQSLSENSSAIEDNESLLPSDQSSAAQPSPATPDPSEVNEAGGKTNVVPFRSNNKMATRPPSGVTGEERVQPAKRAPAEMVKVSSSLLDGLVNLAGETSISRGLLEQQVNDFGFTLEEMDTTLERLREQLRRLDIETEAQVLFRQERHDNYEDFDPLEMDRYSHIQQLSRSLVESASDLLDLKQTLVDKTRDAETLLLQQSRVNTELQEGLMQTRMVPFSRLVPRLRRIVRQIGNELGKKAELEIFNAEGQLDRTVLERMISPLEHMLRNAVDHGIEIEEERVASGKNAIGKVDLRLSREGGDVVIRLKDDGKGIDLTAVRKKAIERGLMTEESDVADQEVLQFILQSGFSTASSVTQISGRGVGMDVVHSEVKQLGGSMYIESTQGQGTMFTIRLPITVAVTRALMVRCGDDLYAVPLSSIEGIVRVSPLELQNQLKSPNPTYTYAGHEYQIDNLSGMLGGLSRSSNLEHQGRSLPVVLVRGADRSVAFQVDTLLGSREIVVKTLGPQFAAVVGVSGGTILGDGSVVIILDLPAMIRSDIAAIMHQSAQALEEQVAEREEDRATQVLVVDDSVTVRKVTSRLLERNGMEALVAKDGVDAMALLQDHKPDVILLDIEMPRMDGFEVASQVRHDARLQNVPIIMITSRTGDKHRDRALSLGVRRYMGKPFQETELMENIHALVDR